MYIKSLLPKEHIKNWKIMAICRGRGDCQVDDFLYNLPHNCQKDGDRVRTLFKYVTSEGPQHLDLEVCHDVAPGIYEFIRGKIRILWFYDEGKIIVCSNAFIKKKQKTPITEKNAAVSAKKDYFAAKTAGELREMREGEDDYGIR